MLSFDFDETYSVCRAFNSKPFDKKKFSKSFCFDTDTVKILNAVKIENSQKSMFFIILTGDFDTFES